MSNKDRAAELKRKGNELFKASECARAAELYAEAEHVDPTDPVYPSNLSAALYEIGNYVACVSAIIRAWRILRKQSNHRLDLVLRLSARLAKALCCAVRAEPSLRERFVINKDDTEELREYATHSHPQSASVPATEEPINVWREWTEIVATGSAYSQQAADVCLRKLSELPIFMKPPDDWKEYYPVGDDHIIDLTTTWGSIKGGDPLDVDKLPDDMLSKISFLFGGAGDGRHAFGTIAGLYQAYQGLSAAKKPKFHAHLTLLDIHPTAIARELCMLMLMDRLNSTSDPISRAELQATFMYTFCGVLMPDYCYDRLMTVVKDLSERLSTSPTTLPPWIHVEASTIPAVLSELEYWIRTRKSARKMLEHHKFISAEDHWKAHSAMVLGDGKRGGEFGQELRESFLEKRRDIEAALRKLSDEELAQKPWMPPGITPQRARFVFNRDVDFIVDAFHQSIESRTVWTHEQEWYKYTRALLPPPELRKRHPRFVDTWMKVKSHEKVDETVARKLSNHVESSWRPNITLFDSSFNDPKYHPSGDGYEATSSDNVFSPVWFINEFNRRHEPDPDPDNEKRNDIDTLAFDVLSTYLEEVATALEGLEGHVMIEFIASGVAEGLWKMRVKRDTTRPPEFPRQYTRMWLSNVPDYTHGPMNEAIYVVPNVQDDPQAGVACNCLLNTSTWGTDDEFFYTYSQLLVQDVPRYLGCRVIQSQAVMDVLILGPLPLPRPLSQLATRDELMEWLTRVLFNTFIPGRTKEPPENVRLPHNLVTFFVLLMHLHRVGFPGHWLSDFLGRVLHGSMVSDIAPYADVWPIPVDDRLRRVPSRRVRTDPWLVEFENIIAISYHAIPFPIATILPEGFSRDPEDILVWEARVNAAIPFSTEWNSLTRFVSPYEPVTRLLFYSPAHVVARSLITSMRTVFEGSSSPAPGTFFFLTAQELVQYGTRIWFRLSRRRIERMKGEKWNIVAYRQDTGEPATYPVSILHCTLVE